MKLIMNLIMKLFPLMLCLDNDTYVNYMMMFMIMFDVRS